MIMLKYSDERIVRKVGQSRKYVTAVCLCGNKFDCLLSNLKSGSTKSCGCLRKRLTKQRNQKLFTKHGMKNTSEYRAWNSMKQRCSNSKISMFPYYGGRGINYDKKWESFEAFYADMGKRPKGFSLERVNNQVGYNKNNCVWASKITQANNKRNNKFITIDFETRTLAEWCRKYSKDYPRVWQRIYRDNWSVKKALEIWSHS